VPLELGPDGGFFPKHGASVLAVLLHAYNHSPESLEPVAAAFRDACPDSDIFAPRLPVSTFSWADPDRIAAAIVAGIDECHGRQQAQTDATGYRSIVLIGHSLGAVLARKVWALAHGAAPSGEIDRARARPWAASIERIVLLAALSRGWMISSALDPVARLMWTIGTAWGNVCRFVLRREPLIFGFRRGAPFLTTARLQCLTVAAGLREQRVDLPVTVQLLGTADDYVAPTDNVDLATAGDFNYLEVTEATHRGIVTLEEGNSLAQFRLALTADPESLAAAALAPEDVFDLFEESVDDHDAAPVATANRNVRHVVFVIHGIRDRGFWTRRIARRIKQLARHRGGCRCVTSTYGYFPMGPFLTPWTRRAKVEWLLDQYVTAKALYPAADFSYVGHSNGTYLLARALELCPAVRFRRVVFAGSVVPCRYDWRRFLPAKPAVAATPPQVERLVNYVATADWVVAIFPHGLERLRLPDLGGAGHQGFIDRPGALVTNVQHVVGGHSAALVAANWDEMAEFVLGGPEPRADRGTEPSAAVAWLGRSAPLLWCLLILVIVGIGGLILAPLGARGSMFAALFALYLSLLRIVATKA
jgi:pimeloyl-ACP methyl ester carboxylesterase